MKKHRVMNFACYQFEKKTLRRSEKKRNLEEKREKNTFDEFEDEEKPNSQKTEKKLSKKDEEENYQEESDKKKTKRGDKKGEKDQWFDYSQSQKVFHQTTTLPCLSFSICLSSLIDFILNEKKSVNIHIAESIKITFTVIFTLFQINSLFPKSRWEVTTIQIPSFSFLNCQESAPVLVKQFMELNTIMPGLVQCPDMNHMIINTDNVTCFEVS